MSAGCTGGVVQPFERGVQQLAVSLAASPDPQTAERPSQSPRVHLAVLARRPEVVVFEQTAKHEGWKIISDPSEIGGHRATWSGPFYGKADRESDADPQPPAQGV